jgi:uncharacterized protein (TIGR02246 family)
MFTSALTIALVSGCGPAEPSPEAPLSDTEARATIEAMMSGWDAAVEAGDPGANASVYTEDAIRMQPNMPALVGREAIQTWMQAEADTYTFEGSNERLEVRALSADWILFRSEGSFVRTPKAGGEPRVFQEKWLSLAQRQPDGTWKIYRDGGSSILPR